MDLSWLEDWWDRLNKRRLIEIVLVALVTFGVTVLLRWDFDKITYPVGREDIPAGVYATLGDICIYLGVLILGAPWGPAVVAVSMAAADLAVGSKLYFIGTLLIKFAMAYFVAAFALQCNTPKRCLAIAGLAEGLMFILYFFYDLVFVNYSVAVHALPINLLQGVVNCLLGALILYKVPVQYPRRMPRIRRRKNTGRFDEEF